MLSDANKSIALAYFGAFDRNPDPTGLGYYDAKVELGQMTLLDVTTALTGSAEFQQVHQGETRRAIISDFYTDVIGRPADAAGLDFYDKGGQSLASILAQFAASGEARDNNFYAIERLDLSVWHGQPWPTLAIDNSPIVQIKEVDVPGPTVTVTNTVTVTQHMQQIVGGTVDPMLQKVDGTFLNGSGISATGFDVVRNVEKGVEIDLRGEHYGTGPMSIASVDPDGTVHFAATAGLSPLKATRYDAGLDYGVKGDLSKLTLTLQLDTDPTAGVTMNTLTHAAGSAVWTDSTGATVIADDIGKGVGGGPSAIANSQNSIFGIWLGAGHPPAAGDHLDAVLTASDATGIVGSAHIVLDFA